MSTTRQAPSPTTSPQLRSSAACRRTSTPAPTSCQPVLTSRSASAGRGCPSRRRRRTRPTPSASRRADQAAAQASSASTTGTRRRRRGEGVEHVHRRLQRPDPLGHARGRCAFAVARRAASSARNASSGCTSTDPVGRAGRRARRRATGWPAPGSRPAPRAPCRTRPAGHRARLGVVVGWRAPPAPAPGRPSCPRRPSRRRASTSHARGAVVREPDRHVDARSPRRPARRGRRRRRAARAACTDRPSSSAPTQAPRQPSTPSTAMPGSLSDSPPCAFSSGPTTPASSSRST